jgi:hypothetical protein
MAGITVISGPAIVTFNSAVYYTVGDIVVNGIRETWKPKVALGGTIDEILKAQYYDITFAPVEIADLTKMFPYAPTNVGTSIFGAACTIQTKAGQLYTFGRAGIRRAPRIKMSANAQPFGEMTIRATGKVATEWTTSAAFLVIASSAFADTSFDAALVSAPGYTAAYGASYTALDAIDGFDIAVEYSTSPIYADRYGLVDELLTGIDVSCTFTPASCTEAEWATLVAADGADAILPGESLGHVGTDLIISKGVGFLRVTIPDAGIANHGLVFGMGHRFGPLVFGNKHTWAVGVGVAPITIEVQSA